MIVTVTVENGIITHYCDVREIKTISYGDATFICLVYQNGNQQMFRTYTIKEMLIQGEVV